MASQPSRHSRPETTQPTSQIPNSSSRIRMIRLCTTYSGSCRSVTTTGAGRRRNTPPTLRPHRVIRSRPCAARGPSAWAGASSLRASAHEPAARSRSLTIDGGSGHAMASSGSSNATATSSRRVVLGVDAVAGVGGVGEGLEAVQEPARDVERVQRLVVQPERRRLRRTSASPRRASTTTSWIAPWAQRTSLASPAAAAPVHPAHHPARAARLRVLHERVGIQPRGRARRRRRRCGRRSRARHGTGSARTAAPRRGSSSAPARAPTLRALLCRRRCATHRRPCRIVLTDHGSPLLEDAPPGRSPAGSAGRTTAGSCSTSATSPPRAVPRGRGRRARPRLPAADVAVRGLRARAARRRHRGAGGGAGPRARGAHRAAPRGDRGGGRRGGAARAAARRWSSPARTAAPGSTASPRTGSPRCRSAGRPTSSSTACFGVMHEADQRAALRTRVDAVAPGGTLVLMFHSLAAIMDGGQWNALRLGHYAYYSTPGMVGMLAELGMTVTSAHRFPLYGGTVVLTAVARRRADPPALAELLAAERATGVTGRGRGRRAGRGGGPHGHRPARAAGGAPGRRTAGVRLRGGLPGGVAALPGRGGPHAARRGRRRFPGQARQAHAGHRRAGDLAGAARGRGAGRRAGVRLRRAGRGAARALPQIPADRWVDAGA